ncbi:MAG: pterin-4-alpha-carbinolamine dehydratase [Deltaproteobacteria bacterium CG11_big_fil_rev_8_21_14_0_20_45_16]|nr:MAG: pterin-4-alpha-carbinolamine dehydratase [Deltaproteobacteria bacterium CG11_big_fil_rev_8_21_14_0_20_45_16]
MQAALPKNWNVLENRLCRRFEFLNFVEAFSFMTAVALEAEKANHHPDWRNVYNTLEISLCTHDAGNTITNKDYDLANKINSILDKKN